MDSFFLSSRDLVFIVPVVVLMFFALRHFDDRRSGSAKAQRIRTLCAYDENGEPEMCDPDGRPCRTEERG